jgi:excisionase family DNA binding protein
MDKKLLLRVTEAAAQLGIGRSTMYRLVRTEQIPTVHIGAALRIPQAALEALVAGLTTTGGVQVQA